MKDSVFCPIVNINIEAIDCIVTSDCAEGMLKPSATDDRFTDIKNWREICLNCPNHEQD